jgi:hypothetical protein
MRALVCAYVVLVVTGVAGGRAQAPGIAVPDWAWPGSATHKQVAPPADFHRTSRTSETPIGIFQGQSDIGAAVVEGSSSYDAATKKYAITSAGYNIWYSRDEFRFLWKKTSGDVSLAGDVTFPNPEGYNDRKVVLVIRKNLDDNSKEVMAGQHGTGMVHLAAREEGALNFRDYEYRVAGIGLSGNESPTKLTNVMPKRIGIEKRGDSIALYISVEGEPLHQFGPPIQMHFDGPFYVGIGFCSHQPATLDTGMLGDVLLENAAGRMR